VSFEEIMARLEAIALRLEDEELDLDAALALFEEGVAELRAASSYLAKAETRLKQLTEAADGVFKVTDLRA
jgi:exodeoxyribonuclease VII small subunit